MATNEEILEKEIVDPKSYNWKIDTLKLMQLAREDERDEVLGGMTCACDYRINQICLFHRGQVQEATKETDKRITELEKLLKRCYPFIGYTYDSEGRIDTISVDSGQLKQDIMKALDEVKKHE